MINKNTLYFYLLNEDYFQNYQILDEFQKDNSRGHGVMILDIDDLMIAIPLRSGIPTFTLNSNHIFPYQEYTKTNGKKCLRALDFSKMTIIEEKYLNTKTTYIFKDENEKQFYLDNFNRIYTRVNNYVIKYKKICSDIENGKKVSFLTIKPYRFSTLRNFHTELNISLTKEKFIEQLNKF
ncbi:hypothetical protein NGG16_16530 [Enterococcus casseliflavus]|uniref:hypothetical protein n=1 Tax=Enterococcus casseliflavus TaxID=37734 RepID=UPI002DB7F1F4|nr:hypothetical protein [Enterococcus casseliflavus]MEB8419042.1 hypothetical protein [Enterococcus casseliflavus]